MTAAIEYIDIKAQFPGKLLPLFRPKRYKVCMADAVEPRAGESPGH